MMTRTSLRRARAAVVSTLLAAFVLTGAPAFADRPDHGADPPGRSEDAPGRQEATPGQAQPAGEPATPEPAGPPADVPAGPPAETPAGPPAHAPAGPPADVPAAGGRPDEVPPSSPGAGEGAGNGEVPPGNRGTVKIHRVGTPDDDRRNEPKVCAFRIVGFGFPEDAALVVTIAGHGGPNAGTGTFGPTAVATDTDGGFAIAGPALPDGMYRLTVENTTAPGGAKQKVFKVECPLVPDEPDESDESDESDEPGVGATEEEPTPRQEEPEVLPTSQERTLGTAATGGATAAALPTEVAGVQVSRPGLAFSGADVAGLAFLGAALIGGGTILRRRHA